MTKIETEPKDITLKIAGKPFRCGCGCNVFRHPKPNSELYPNPDNFYVCNACSKLYETE